MLIIDMSNLVFSQVLDFHQKTKEQADLQLIRNLVLDKMIQIKSKTGKYADEIVCAFDSRHYWRKDIFPYYKGKRKEQRAASSFDWGKFFPLYDEFKQEIKDYFPVKYIEVYGAEADDIMAVLGQTYGPLGNVCIVTSDKDMIQIQHMCPLVKQWSPWHAKFLTPKNADYNLFEHIVKGDVGDGVPNILSDDDTFMNPDKRQKPITKAKLAEWSLYGINQAPMFCPTAEALDKFTRNKKLIDLREVPTSLAEEINDAYTNAVIPRGKMFTYLTANRLTKILKEGGL